ncbi:putative Protein disulfide isomerase-like 2-3 [Hypsibius exemplaris]|uniref:Thioredoxin domain-containing protein n=1 Tax=Hypsibius exemplaris TaxID=2072580 RepID=A0A1W0W9F2_HYPEX|nr:putative Protein disulfide isomerase-like 2-3 [Hypsibius exemplaris]
MLFPFLIACLAGMRPVLSQANITDSFNASPITPGYVAYIPPRGRIRAPASSRVTTFNPWDAIFRRPAASPVDQDNKGNIFQAHNVVALNEQNFDRLVLRSAQPWLVQFYAPWCRYSKQLAPEWAKVATTLAGRVDVGSVDMVAEKSFHNRYPTITGYPTILFFPRGLKTQSHFNTYTGEHEADEITAWVDQTMDSTLGSRSTINRTTTTTTTEATVWYRSPPNTHNSGADAVSYNRLLELLRQMQSQPAGCPAIDWTDYRYRPTTRQPWWPYNEYGYGERRVETTTKGTTLPPAFSAECYVCDSTRDSKCSGASGRTVQKCRPGQSACYYIEGELTQNGDKAIFVVAGCDVAPALKLPQLSSVVQHTASNGKMGCSQFNFLHQDMQRSRYNSVYSNVDVHFTGRTCSCSGNVTVGCNGGFFNWTMAQSDILAAGKKTFTTGRGSTTVLGTFVELVLLLNVVWFL